MRAVCGATRSSAARALWRRWQVALTFASAGYADERGARRAPTRASMLKTSGARESSRIQQRWGEEVGSSCEPPAAGRPAKHLGAKVCSTKRVLLELFVFFVLLLWVVLIALNLASRMEPCQLTRQTVRGDLGNRFIHLKSWNGAAFWYVRTDGGPSPSPGPNPNPDIRAYVPCSPERAVRAGARVSSGSNPNPNPN